MSRRSRRNRLLPGGLTPSQRAFLLYGDSFSNDPEPFANSAEMKTAWNLHKASLMSQCAAGRRPAAFWVELDLAVWRPADQLSELMRLNLITLDEQLQIDLHGDEMLRRTQAPQFNSAYDREYPGLQNCDSTLAAEFEVASRWHAHRGRVELSATYRRRSENVRAVLKMEK